MSPTLLVVVDGAGSAEDGGIYGKVPRVEPDPRGGAVVDLSLTSVSPDTRRVLQDRLAASV